MHFGPPLGRHLVGSNHSSRSASRSAGSEHVRVYPDCHPTPLCKIRLVAGIGALRRVGDVGDTITCQSNPHLNADRISETASMGPSALATCWARVTPSKIHVAVQLLFMALFYWLSLWSGNL